MFVALLSTAVFVWAVLALPETRDSRRSRRASAAICWPTSRALAASPRFFGYALCAGLGSAPFFSLSGRAPPTWWSTMLGRTSAEYGLWFFIPSIGFMAGNFAVSRLTAASPSTP